MGSLYINMQNILPQDLLEDIQLKYPNFYGNLNSFLTSYSSSPLDASSPDQSRHQRGTKNATLSFISLSQKKHSFTTLPASASTNTTGEAIKSKPPVAESSSKQSDTSRQFKVYLFKLL
jgi:hypothetical protein